MDKIKKIIYQIEQDINHKTYKYIVGLVLIFVIAIIL
jgi:hypothetical protein